MANVHNMQGQCGMAIVTGLYETDTVAEQIAALDEAFSTIVGAVIFTDRLDAVDNSWKEAKKRSIKGPIVVNPNTKAEIQHYTFTKALLAKWKRDLKKKK